MITTYKDFCAILGRSHITQSVADLTFRMGVPIRTTSEFSTYLDYVNEGVQLRFTPSGTLESVFLFSENYEEHREFRGEMPSGIRFNDSSVIVKTKMGRPVMNGGGKIGVLGNLIPLWEKFRLEGSFCTVQYGGKTGGVDLVTLMRDSEA